MIRQPSYSRFLKPYYIINLLLVFAYPISRYFYTKAHLRAVMKEDMFGYTKEDGILLTLAVITIIKWRKSCTIDHFFAEVFWLAKIAEISLYFFVDFAVCLYYVLACTMLYLFFRTPKYDGPNKMVRIKSQEHFEELVLSKKPSMSDSRYQEARDKNRNDNKDMSEMNMWLVLFFADWAETCVFTKPIWAEYSIKYSTKKMRFAEVDVANQKELADEYTINTSVMSRQLPTLIMFEDGKEVLRFPPIDDKTGKVGKVLKYDKIEVAKFFELDKRWLATLKD
jgi:thiol-disulfide isomerase/thioredoxin